MRHIPPQTDTVVRFAPEHVAFFCVNGLYILWSLLGALRGGVLFRYVGL